MVFNTFIWAFVPKPAAKMGIANAFPLGESPVSDRPYCKLILNLAL